MYEIEILSLGKQNYQKYIKLLLKVKGSEYNDDKCLLFRILLQFLEIIRIKVLELLFWN